MTLHLPTNRITTSTGASCTELLPPGARNPNARVIPLHEQGTFLTTRAVRVGGGYVLQKYEKKIPEDRSNIRLLRHLITLKQAGKHDLLNRINKLIDENVLLSKNNHRLTEKNYHTSLLDHQRHLATLQRIQAEKEKLDTELAQKTSDLAYLKRSSEEITLKLSTSINNLNQGLVDHWRRIYELKNYADVSRPLLAIKAQKLVDELEEVVKKNREKIEATEKLHEKRKANDMAANSQRVEKILSKSMDKVLATYPDRLKNELYLNNQMKFEINYCNTELETLRLEIQVLEEKIKNVPKKKFPTRMELETDKVPEKVPKAFVFKDHKNDEIYTFDIEQKLNLPI